MKKQLSIVLCLVMLMTLCFGTSFSASAASAEINGTTYTWDQEVELLPESPDDWEINGAARITGSREQGYTFTDMNKWGANLADVPQWSNEEGWALYYDIEIESGTMGIRLQWWNCNVSEALVNTLDLDGGGDNGDHLQKGKYKGILPVSEFTSDYNSTEETEEIKWLLNVYVVMGRMSLKTMKLVHLADEPDTTPTTTTKAQEAATTTTTEAGATTTTTTAAGGTTTTTTAAGGATTTTTAAADEAPAEKDGLSAGAIVGIVVAALVVIGGATAGILVAKKKK